MTTARPHPAALLADGDAPRVDAANLGPESSAAPSVYLETFGCQMNVLDSELLRSQLGSLGYRFVEDWASADVVLYNTCSVREHAEQKVLSRIGQVAQRKRREPGVVLGVIGCMAEQYGPKLARRYAAIDLLCGPAELDKAPMLIDNALKTRPASRRTGTALQGSNARRSATLDAAEDQLENIDLARSFSPDAHEGSAYVRITRGCNKFCTYCVVPRTRGPEVHRPPEHIVEECRRLVDAGVAEITLLGQTVNHYHFDEGAAASLAGIAQPQVGSVVTATGPRAAASRRIVTFAELLHRIHEAVPRLKRLRFVTSFPRDFGDDILQVIAESPRICRYLHLPVQSGSNRMLEAMNRGYTVESYLALLDRVRAWLPDAQVASDLICGFPGETEADHEATCDLLRRARFKNCFVFKYSPRPGTAAFERLPDDVADADKRRRNNELLAIQGEISGEIHASMVGRRFEVFIESVSDYTRKGRPVGVSGQPGGDVELRTTTPVGGGWVQLCGRTDGDLIVMVDGPASRVGEVVSVEIERSAPLTLFGRLVGDV